jgi:putative ABC transport system ATP-binding protein
MNDYPVLLRAEGLHKSYGNGVVKALVEVSLEVRHGEYLCITGPSGSGKSTLLNMLGALDQPDRGEVFFQDQPLSTIRRLGRFRARELGFVFQSFLLLSTLTAAENVQIPMFSGSLTSAARNQKARELLHAVNLSHRADHLPAELSVGERQRVAIARSLANDPKLILADEPTGNLDSRSADEILNLFDRIRKDRELTLVVITHSQVVTQRAERIVRIWDGRIVDHEDINSPPVIDRDY